MFRWAGELNVMKQALVGNLHEPATLKSIDAWAPFMNLLRERNIPLTLHSDLGNDAQPDAIHFPDGARAEGLPRQRDRLGAHGSVEGTHENGREPARGHDEEAARPVPQPDARYLLGRALQRLPADGEVFIEFFNAYPTRILPGSDFVAAGTKDYSKYENELEITSRVLRLLTDEAFRNIALGENFFRFTGIDYTAQQLCKSPGRSVPAATRAAAH
jgi:hypothetical protein